MTERDSPRLRHAMRHVWTGWMIPGTHACTKRRVTTTPPRKICTGKRDTASDPYHFIAANRIAPCTTTRSPSAAGWIV